MNEQTVERVLEGLGENLAPLEMMQFRTEEDGTPYHVWKLTWDDRTAVLKKTSPDELAIYHTFLAETEAAPKVYAQGEVDGVWYMLLEHIPGETLCHCTRERLQRALDALIGLQRRYWEDKAHEDLGYGFARCYHNREKRLPYMADLTAAYEAYLQAFCTVPRTLCNDDMLPINVIVNGERAVILDWEYAGILPYPCALTRLIAYGPEESGGLFPISDEDRAFALDYYYEHLIREKGISREVYDHTMTLFLLKEYSEWVYCAHSSGDLEIPYYKPNYARARALAAECVRRSVMKLMFLFGDAAVGKMTVGQELMKITDLRLFHNHMTIEPVLEIFGTFDGNVIKRLREVIFEEFAKSDNYGMIFTVMWAFDMQSDWDYLAWVRSIFEPYGTEFYYVELVADQKTRLERNTTENRLIHKASKRDLEASNARLLRDDANHRLESYPGEIPYENYIKIDNTNLSPETVAAMIKERFGL